MHARVSTSIEAMSPSGYAPDLCHRHNVPTLSPGFGVGPEPGLITSLATPIVGDVSCLNVLESSLQFYRVDLNL